jgi:ribose transport system permease protein
MSRVDPRSGVVSHSDDSEVTAVQEAPADVLGRPGLAQRLLGGRTVRTVLGVYAIVIVLLGVARLVNPSLSSGSYLKTVVGLAAFTAVVAYGQGIVVLTGGLDLSIPSTMAVVGVTLTGYTLGSNQKALYMVPLVLALGAFIGMCNGLGVVYLRLSPVVMTLASNVILSGVVLVETNGTPTGFVPSTIITVVQGNTLGGQVPTIIVILAIFTTLGVLLLNATVFGRQVYAVGSNRTAAYLSGVPVNRIVVSVYALSGLCAAIAGIMVSAYSNQSYLGMGDPYLLLSLAAVVVGGSAILGGRGYYLGTLAGAILLTEVSTILSGTSLPDAVKQIVYAVIILGAVLLTRQQQ